MAIDASQTPYTGGRLRLWLGWVGAHLLAALAGMVIFLEAQWLIEVSTPPHAGAWLGRTFAVAIYTLFGAMPLAWIVGGFACCLRSTLLLRQ
jgi:hypothetical protein